MELAPTPPAPAARRTLYEEIVAVLAISLLASAAYAIVSLLTAPVKGVTVAAANPDPLFANQVLGFVFGLAPALVVVHLVRRDGEGVGAVGLAWDRPRQDLVRGTVLFAVVGLGGLGIYLVAVRLGVNRLVVPASALLGAAFLVVADALARTLFAPREIHIGVVTAFIGAPVFVYLLRRVG